MMSRLRLSLAAGLLLAGFSANLSALPSFARQTGASCAACHAMPTLQLTAMGLDFQANGFRMEATKFDSKDLSLEKTSGITLEAAVNSTKAAVPSTQVAQPNPDIQIYSGGPVSEHFSYLVMYHFNRSADSTQNVEQAYIQYNQQVSKGILLSVRGGSFQPLLLRDFGLGAPTTLAQPLVLTTPLSPNASSTSPFTLANNLAGIDLNFRTDHFDFAFGATSPTTGSAGTNPTNRKDTFVDAIWRFDSNASGLGLFRYDGTHLVFNTPEDPTTGLAFRDDFSRSGIVFRFIRDQWRCIGGLFNGVHTSDVLGTTIKNRGYYGELNFNLTESFGTYARYERVQPALLDPTQDTKLVLIGLNGMAFKNERAGGRWVLEGSRSDQNGLANQQVTLDFLLAF